jgi:hypothetical protein
MPASENGTVNSHLWAKLAERSPTWKKEKLPAERVLHIDHLFARMQRLNTYEAKTNAMTRIGSNLSQVLPPPFSCE